MFLQVSICPRGGGGGIPACLAGGIPACLTGFLAHTQGELEGSGLWGVPRPTLRGKLRSLAGGVSRPTPMGGSWGSDLGGLQAHTWGVLQAHIQGWSLGSHWGGSPGPHPRGVFQHVLRQTPPPADSYCCGWNTSYWNASLLVNSL